MSQIPYVFPHPYLADEDGFLCIGGDLDPRRLLLAYQYGIFPWFSEGQPIMWFFTSPRLVLFPDDLKISKSMRNILNRDTYHVTFDKAFGQIMDQCSQVYRLGQAGTWITADMKEAYTTLHDQGHAHSVEVWEGEELVGGLYGVAIGKIFYGESMFSHKSNMSKVAFIHLVKHLKNNGYLLIDCQQDTPHLRSLGADLIDRSTFMAYLRGNALENHAHRKWTP